MHPTFVFETLESFETQHYYFFGLIYNLLTCENFLVMKNFWSK